MNATPATPRGDLPTRPPQWPRIAAVVALLAPVAMAVVAVVALAGDVAIAALALALVLLASAAIWFALTRHGRRRAAGAAIAVLAVAGLIVVLVTNWHGLLVLLALLLLLALFGVSARYALGRTGEAAARKATASVVPAGAVDSAVLIINLKSGGGKAQQFHLADRARRAGNRADRPAARAMTCSSSPRAPSPAARRSSEWPEVTAPKLSWQRLPHDTTSRTCASPPGRATTSRSTSASTATTSWARSDAFTDGVERRIDLAAVNDRVFVNNASLGVYAKVVQSDAYRDAKLETWTRMLPDLLGPDAEPIDLRSRRRTEAATRTRRSCSYRTTPIS